MLVLAFFAGRGPVADVVILRVVVIGCGVMRNIMIFAAVMAFLGTVMAQMADKMTATATPAPANTVSRQAAAVGTPASNAFRSISIPRDARGHFQTEGRIDGQRIDFMVDTGASVIALNEKSAARFGLRPSRGDTMPPSAPPTAP